MTRPVKYVLIVLSVLIFIGLTIFIYKIEFKLTFEQIEQISISTDSNHKNGLVWFTLRDEKYNGFFSEGILVNYGVSPDEINMDFSNYTYVVTVGHKLESIGYSYSQMKNRKFIFVPKQFVGIVNLQYEYSPNLYIYRIKKMDIDCDYHEPNKNIFYVK